MSQRLEGKVAVVTGASKGIGASIAKHWPTGGAAVVVNYASGKQGADRVVAEITCKGGRAVAVQADVSRHADIERLFAETKKEWREVSGALHHSPRTWESRRAGAFFHRPTARLPVR